MLLNEPQALTFMLNYHDENDHYHSKMKRSGKDSTLEQESGVKVQKGSAKSEKEKRKNELEKDTNDNKDTELVGETEATRVLDYWFTDPEPGDKPKCYGGKQLDDEIRDKFGDLVQKARNDELKHWEGNPRMTLALIILLDQFGRHIFRGKAESYDKDAYSVQLTRKVLATKAHLSWYFKERVFLCLPLEHTESVQEQVECIKLLTEIVSDAKGTEYEELSKRWLVLGQRHLELIEKFGRFPARNEALGRESTPEELEFLADPWPGYTF